jgi:hypothetical protein
MMWLILRVFYGPAVLFIGHSERAYLIAAGFAILLVVSVLAARKLKPRTHLLLLVATVLWVLFGLYEEINYEMAGPIRLALILSWPLMLAVSGAAAWIGIRDIVARKPVARNVDQPPEESSLLASSSRSFSLSSTFPWVAFNRPTGIPQQTARTPSSETPAQTNATTAPAPSRPEFLTRRLVGLLVFLGMMVLVVLRATSELALMRESGSDPQMGIWIMFMVSKLVYWVLAGGVVAGVLFFRNPRWRIAMGLVLLVAWTLSIRTESWKLEIKRQSLAEARDPSTTSTRLKQLVQFTGSEDGYELDNRIASNPNATPEILRLLYERHNIGTLMIMARSPRTPEDILVAIVDRDLPLVEGEGMQKWVRKSMKLNPKLPDAIRRKLDEPQPPATK